jgi:lysophospholipase L1-like esterase
MQRSSLFLVFGLAVSLAVRGQTPTPSTNAPSANAAATNAPAAKPPPPVDAWPALFRYKDANAKLPPPDPGEKRVVFFGDSITELWARQPNFFPGEPYIGRGISGQTTMSMLCRFRADVIDLKPAAVVILAGTNDLAQNSGPESMGLIEDDLRSMTELAMGHHIVPILCSVLPASEFPWHKGLEPGPKIVELNQWIEGYCREQHLVFCNYYPAMVNDKLGMRDGLSVDGVHPTAAGFAIMAPLAEDAIKQALP